MDYITVANFFAALFLTATVIFLLLSLFAKLIIPFLPFKFKLSGNEEQVLEHLEPAKREQYLEVLTLLKVKKILLFCSSGTGAVFLLLKAVVNFL